MKKNAFNLEELMNMVNTPLMLPELTIIHDGRVERVLFMYDGYVILNAPGNMVDIIRFDSNTWNPTSSLDTPVIITSNLETKKFVKKAIAEYNSVTASMSPKEIARRVIERLDGVYKKLDEERLNHLIHINADKIATVKVGVKEDMAYTDGYYWYHGSPLDPEEIVYQTNTVWGTPCAKIEWKDGTESTFDCWVEDNVEEEV